MGHAPTVEIPSGSGVGIAIAVSTIATLTALYREGWLLAAIAAAMTGQAIGNLLLRKSGLIMIVDMKLILCTILGSLAGLGLAVYVTDDPGILGLVAVAVTYGYSAEQVYAYVLGRPRTSST